MFRIVFRALLLVLCALLFHQVFSASPYRKGKMSTKAQFMSNMSVGIYLALEKFMPFEMVSDKDEWLNINGGMEDHAGVEKYRQHDDDSEDKPTKDLHILSWGKGFAK